MIRTRSRPFQETPRRTTSPLHRHAVTPIRRPPKRRRVGRSALAISKLQNRSSDSADSDHDNGVYRLTTQIYASSPKLRARKTLPRLRTRTLQRSALDDTMSPRKRKRSEEGSPSTSPGSGSWIETEDEMPEFMAEGKPLCTCMADLLQRTISCCSRHQRMHFIDCVRASSFVCGKSPGCGQVMTR